MGTRIEEKLRADLNARDMEIAYLHSLLTECGNELFKCDDDGVWISGGHDGGFMRCFCSKLNEIVHGVPQSR